MTYQGIPSEKLIWHEDKDRNLKALPYVIDWFERARVAIADNDITEYALACNWFEAAGEAVADDDEEYNIEERKLSAFFQFAIALPLLFEGIAELGIVTKQVC